MRIASGAALVLSAAALVHAVAVDDGSGGAAFEPSFVELRLAKDVKRLQERCAAVLRRRSRPSLTRPTSLPMSDDEQRPGSSLHERLLVLESKVERFAGYLELGGRVQLVQELSFADFLFAGHLLRSRIHDPSTSRNDRLEAFSKLAFLDGGEAWLLGCADIWIREALTAESEAEKLHLVIPACDIEPDATMRALLDDFARYDPSDRVRENAVNALSQYPDEASWNTIRAALQDPAERVRHQARRAFATRRHWGDDQ